MSGKPQNKATTTWSSNFAYAIGLLVTDGNLSKDGRHIDLTSKDIQQLKNFMECLNINVKIGFKTSGYTQNKITRIQFGDVNLYKLLIKIGLTPAKTKTINALKIPYKYFFDFLRGLQDGDGSFYSYWDPRWKSSFMFYLTFVSASKKHLIWIQNELKQLIDVKGYISIAKGRSTYQLRYAKKESLIIIKKMYRSKSCICLTRKRLKIKKVLAMIGESIA